MDNLSSEQIYRKIAESSVRDGIGFFVGAGFSRALCENPEEQALGWGELIEHCENKLKSQKNDSTEKKKQVIGRSYPEIASDMCRTVAKNTGQSIQETQKGIKEIIAQTTYWLPSEEKRLEYSDYMKILQPDFFITTNYDQVIESILDGRGYPLDSEADLTSPKSKIPVYHMHGSRLNAEGIIIFQEDYVSLFRPNDYRQIKLALTIRESTTVILGYGLGDMNVLSAIDWAENYYQNSTHTQSKADIYQVVRKSDNLVQGLEDESNSSIHVLEVDDISEFMEKLTKEIEIVREEDKANQDEIDHIIKNIKETGDTYFSDGSEEYVQEIKKLVNFEKESHLIVDLLDFIEVYDKGYQKVFRDARTISGNFEKYAESLKMPLAIMDQYEDLNQMHPNLFSVIMNHLNCVMEWMGPRSERGKSWKAYELWMGYSISDNNLQIIQENADYRGLDKLRKLIGEKRE